jgi:predicted nucleic acid-binding protein
MGCASRARAAFAMRQRGETRIVEASADLFWRGFELYGQRTDKDWSLTDCISFVVMRDEDLTGALTGDHHFEQAGFTALLA